ncbi:hypothetical protein JGH11_05345 [Dysgonomonas sp. Marseille-P4677]|uniref:Ig-like domain-containing protein n=1 Tax=Dysgonomonas sp. Marseille-P4677 TaxID=2364790 RepID=UPI0019148644|nr:hypothetical protein [Dysgonomonas sp. Marseille-P4677]MBK5720288.1 hypothetical protein [Dysgonomonas sp. Marseille-P4677]
MILKNKHYLLSTTILILTLILGSKAMAQSELGVVWVKEYNNIPAGLKGSPQGLEAQPLYFAETGQTRYLLTGTEDTRTGFIAMLDESGNILKYWSIPIPSYYDKYIARTPQSLGYTYPDDIFGLRVLGLLGTYNVQDILASSLNTAVMKKDGSILAFGFVTRFRADLWKAPEDAVTDYSPGSHGSSRMKQGVWMVAIDPEGNIVKNQTARGAEAYKIFPYEDKILLTGLDIHTTGKIGAAGGEGVGMLHEYTLDGIFVAERCPNSKDGVAITGANKYPDGNILLFGWQDVAMKINPDNPNVSLGTFNANTVSSGAINMPMAGTPTIDGGSFFNPQYATENRPQGASFAKLNSNGTLAYRVYENKSSRMISYENPLILNMNENKYVGTIQKNGTNYIYEIKDKGTTYELTEGDPYPNNTSLRIVGLQDGFFSMGFDPVTRKTSIAKLSTCANFQLNIGGSSDVILLSEKTFPSRTIQHTGNKGIVTYKWDLVDISTGGNAIENWSGITKSGMTNVIPAQAFKLATGKDFAILQYTITAVDNYNISGVPQSCQQSYNIQVKIYKTLPDNIQTDPSGCFVPFEPIDFKIKEKWSQANQGNSNTGVLVGDLNGDGLAEIIGYSPDLTKINIYNGADGVTKATINLSSAALGSGGWYPVMTAVLVDADRNGMGEIIVANPNKTLTSYEADTTGGTFNMVKKWPLLGTVTFDNPITVDNFPQPIVADLNGDGIPELIVYNKIYNAVTGAYLGETEPIASANVGRVPNRVGNKASNFITTADFDEDGLPEIVAGGKIYKVTFAANKQSVTCTKLYENTSIGDGFTAVADIDMDGKLDVIVTNVQNAGQTRLYVWSPIDGRAIDNILVYTDAGYPAQSYPFVGDIDGVVDPLTGEKHPEICLTIKEKVLAYKYDSATGKMKEKWTLETSDTSGGTGITLFDFNNDGINELVYRDQTLLRILDGRADNTPPILSDAGASIACASGTAFEFPIIADVDGDGSVNVCVTCSAGYGIGPQYIRVYESGSKPWAPTRQVWNQVNYEPTQINNDLTVPTTSIPKNMKFEVNGVKHSPFNGTLIQVPISNINMEPVLDAPDPFVVKLNAVLKDETTVKLSVIIANQGQKYVNSGLPVSLYKGSTFDPSSLLVTKPLGVSLAPGSSTELELMELDIKNMAANYSIRLQDDGTTYPAPGSYMDCNMNNNTVSVSGIFANNDNLLAFMDKTNSLHITSNDVIPTTCSTPSVILLELPKHGTATPNGSFIDYTPDTDYIGNDTLKYQISCGSGTSAAYVYINVVPQPDNISDATCYIEPPKQTWSVNEVVIKNTTQYDVGQPPYVGDVDGDGKPEILALRASSNIIDILKGDGTLKKSITINYSYVGAVPIAAIGRIKYNNEKDTMLIVSISSSTKKLHGYNIDGKLLWNSSTDYGAQPYGAAVNLADIDGDGWAELIVRNKIFAAESGKLLLEIPGGNTGISHGWSDNYFQVGVGSVLENGRQQIFAGNAVYDVKITNREGTTGNSLLSTTTVTPEIFDGTIAPIDGCAQMVDFDLDGHPDVIVSTIDRAKNACYVYAWSPFKQKIISSAKIANVYKKNIPFIGDIDGDQYPEIVLIHGRAAGDVIYPETDKITALKYDPSSPLEMKTFWQIDHYDRSGATSITLFDFNQDNIAELVYRDEKLLRIINGSLKSHITGMDTTAVYNLATFECGSITTFEYPIVADVDDDGQAEIVTIGNRPAAFAFNGLLRIYKSGGASWAPARKVWNQYAYNAVNINEDLTVPRIPLNTSTIFPGKDAILGTDDDIRPYNSFLMQQTTLNHKGISLFLAPNIQIADASDIRYEYNADIDKLTIKDLKLINKGDAIFDGPIMISVYNMVINSENLIITQQEECNINKNETITVSIEIEDFGKYIPTDNLIININDDGTGKTSQPVCEECPPNKSDSFANIDLSGLAWANPYKNCIGGTVQFDSKDFSTTGTDVKYKWLNPDSTQLSGIRNPSITNLTLDHAGRYTFIAEGINEDLSIRYRLPYMSVAPKTMYWTGKIDRNWNNIDNWASDISGTEIKAIPTLCTSVHIPYISGANANYPSLKPDVTPTNESHGATGIYGKPEADSIIFHYGSELAYQHQLAYNNAKVQYNFGYYANMSDGLQPTENKDGASALSMKRNRWYPLAAPLKSMASGDFAFGGYPFTWQALHNVISGNTITFENNSVKNDINLAETNNVIIVNTGLYQSGKIGYNDHKHLQGLKGVLEIPYWNNTDEEIYHPGHSYDYIAGLSSFYYFNAKTLQTLHNPIGKMKRGNESYRFIYEGKTEEIISSSGDTLRCYVMNVSSTNSPHVLIGNPFMASINMDHFYEINQNILVKDEGYRLYVDDNGLQWKKYEYRMTDGSYNAVNSLQSFIVTFTTTGAGRKLYFPIEGRYALTGTTTNITPRRIELSGALNVTIKSSEGLEGDYAELSPASSVDESANNVSKLINKEERLTPEVFFIGKNDTSYNLMQIYQPGDKEVSIGIRYPEGNSDLTLTFGKVEEFVALTGITPVLIDKSTGTKQNLVDKNSYTFSQTSTSSKSSYIDLSRFSIRFTSGEASTLFSDDLSVCYIDNVFSIDSSLGIESVIIYNLSGQQIFKSQKLDGTSTYYTHNISLSPSIYVVKVMRTDGKSVSCKFIAK